ncbi:MAG: DNA alkylation repair protein [Candidatus Pacearchaeota archaeon]
MLEELKKELREFENPEKAKVLRRFFKTGKGQYGEGDIFLGIQVPTQRQIAKKYFNLNFQEIQELLNSKIHEERLIALIILTNQYKKAKKDNFAKRQIFEFYIKNINNVNNWDLVDLSAPNIVGEFLQKEDTGILRELAKSKNIWERRIAIISTYSFIRKRSFGEALIISDILLKDEHDLIHKAVGWMLREIGKRNKNVLEIFLQQRHKEMPRTMLRYAIEKFPEEERKKWMKK